jgi:mRNA interferase MazF
MEVARGEVWWADLPDPVASSPVGTHPVLIVQANAFNRSRLSTVVAVVLTTNVRLAEMPGNVLVPAKETGLPKPSVVNVTQVITADRSFLGSRAGKLRAETLERVDHGLSVVLGLI